MDEKTSFIALSLIKGLGNVLISRLVDECGSAGSVFKAADTPGELSKIDGIGAETEKLVRNFTDWENARRAVSRATERGFQIVTLSDGKYPPLLKQIHAAPAVIYVLGELRKEDNLAIAVVGTRFPVKYGTDMAKALSSGLAERGICVVSGMARGIDSAAHRAAIEAGGRTIAVLGSGLDVIYPPENHEIYEKIAQNGAVISAFPPGTEPDKTNFPERNAIISGLSLGTVVVQAAKKSGALITAAFALEQNREVFAVPGRVGEKNSGGANLLIKRGAKLCEGADDIALEISALRHLESPAEEYGEMEAKLAALPEDRKKLLELLRAEPLHIDAIAEKTGEKVSELSTLMLELEIEGLVDSSEGGLYQSKV